MRQTHMILPVLLVAALSACKREPDFDQRYRDAGAKIGQTAEEIDRQIAGTGTPEEEEGAR